MKNFLKEEFMLTVLNPHDIEHKKRNFEDPAHFCIFNKRGPKASMLQKNVKES